MKMISRVALAAALFSGVGGLVVAMPAEAKKKDEQPQGPQYNFSPDVRAAAAAAQDALKAKDYATAETDVAKIEAAAKNDDDQYIGAALRLQLEAGKIGARGTQDPKDDLVLAPILDKLLANPKTPQSDIGRYAYFRGNIAFNGQQYDVAAKLYERAQAAGFVSEAADDLPLQIVKSHIESGDVKGGLAKLQTLIDAKKSAGQPAPEPWYRYAITQVYRTNDIPGTLAWTRLWLTAYPTNQNWRMAIYQFGFQGQGAQRMNKRQRVDLFRLMRATSSLGDAAFYKEYAQSTLDLGLPTETKTVIEDGIAKGVIPSTDPDAKALVAQANKSIGLDKPFAVQEKQAEASKDGALASQTADAYLGAGNYAKAIEYYNLALQKGGPINTDEINTHLGIAMALSGDKAGSKAKFAAVTTSPRTDIANLWTIYADAPPVTIAPPAAAAPATGS